MDADGYARMTDEERARFLHRRHMNGVAAALAIVVVLVLTLFVVATFGDHTPVCGTGQDKGPC